MHEGQLDVPLDVVRALVDRGFPQWADMPIHAVVSVGTVNALFRLGETLSLRFPLTPDDPDAVRVRLEAEHAAAGELLDCIPFASPEPIAIGNPGAGYPLPWSVQTWIPGVIAADDDPSRSDWFAYDVALLIESLRQFPTSGRTFRGRGRGGDLRRHDAWMEECFARSGDLVDESAARAVWNELRDLPREAPDAMCHGDLTPGNVLVDDGRMVGVIDTGGFGPADPALDLVAVWHLLDTDRRQIVRDLLGCDDLEWARGTAWAFEQAMGAIWYYRDTNRVMHEMGRTTLTRIIDDRR